MLRSLRIHLDHPVHNRVDLGDAQLTYTVKMTLRISIVHSVQWSIISTKEDLQLIFQDADNNVNLLFRAGWTEEIRNVIFHLQNLWQIDLSPPRTYTRYCSCMTIFSSFSPPSYQDLFVEDQSRPKSTTAEQEEELTEPPPDYRSIILAEGT